MRYAELFAAALRRSRDGELSTAVEALIERSFGISRTQFWIRKNEVIPDSAGVARFRRALRRLLAGEPLAYILKEKEFYGERFAVSPAVLVPRPETELLVEKALEILGRRPDGSSGNKGAAAPRSDKPRVLDIGAGSGCISVILALKSRAAVTALERSRPALRILRTNIARFGLQGRVRALPGDLFPRRAQAFEMIVANPPYLSCRDWREAPVGIRKYEPREALVAGPAGTEVLERIINRAPRWLAPGGHLLLEIGKGQRRALRGFLVAAGMREMDCMHDYAGIERVIVAAKKKER